MGAPFFRNRAISCPHQGGYLKRLHRPYRFRVWLHEPQRVRLGLNVMTSLNPVYLNAGLMKPRKEFTLVAGEEKPGWERKSISAISFELYDHDFRDRINPHGRPPGTRSAGGIHQEVSEPLQPVIVPLVDL